MTGRITPKQMRRTERSMTLLAHLITKGETKLWPVFDCLHNAHEPLAEREARLAAALALGGTHPPSSPMHGNETQP